MNLCSDDHDEVCYDSSKCPHCTERMEREVKALEGRIEDLEGELAEALERGED